MSGGAGPRGRAHGSTHSPPEQKELGLRKPGSQTPSWAIRVASVSSSAEWGANWPGTEQCGARGHVKRPVGAVPQGDGERGPEHRPSAVCQGQSPRGPPSSWGLTVPFSQRKLQRPRERCPAPGQCAQLLRPRPRPALGTPQRPSTVPDPPSRCTHYSLPVGAHLTPLSSGQIAEPGSRGAGGSGGCSSWPSPPPGPHREAPPFRAASGNFYP